jgi:hypothetical protein
MCDAVWEDRNRFLSDPQVLAVGYQADLEVLESGLFLFNHTRAGCGTTLVIEVGEFVDLSEGPVYRERLTGTEECPEYCLRPNDLSPCPRSCECAYVRDVLQVVRNWKKLPAR